jgi:hypothetical protein
MLLFSIYSLELLYIIRLLYQNFKVLKIIRLIQSLIMIIYGKILMNGKEYILILLDNKTIYMIIVIVILVIMFRIGLGLFDLFLYIKLCFYMI